MTSALRERILGAAIDATLTLTTLLIVAGAVAVCAGIVYALIRFI